MNHHATAPESRHLALPTLSESLMPFVAIDHIEKVFYIDESKSSAPLLLTWLNRAEMQCEFSKIYKITHAAIDEIAAQQAKGCVFGINGMKPDDMHNQNLALDIIQKGALIGAADIHILVRSTFTEIQFRTKGDLRVYTRQISQSEGRAIIRAICQGLSAVKVTYIYKDFQNAQLSGKQVSQFGLTSVRLVRGPCYPENEDNEFATLRLQYLANHKTQKGQTLEIPRRPDGELNLVRMGFTDAQVEQLKEAVQAPNGIIVISGPTGSGKTTTLYELLAHSAREYPEKRLVTIENPVEYPMPWAIQLSVSDTGEGASFSDCLRTSLRMDPDILSVGELRDLESAETAINAALTGHQVWASIHANDPFMIVDRLELIDRERLARAIFCDENIVRAMIAQRLIKALCPTCSTLLSATPNAVPAKTLQALYSYSDPQTKLSRVRLCGNGRLANGKPCPTCDGDGTIGRIAIAEVVITTPELMHDLIHHGTAVARKNHRSRPGSDKSLLENAVLKCLDGLCDPRHLNAINKITPKEAA